MSRDKKYYWIKLKDTFMTSDAVDYLMSLPGGANYVVLYQVLCLKTINTGGRLSRQIGEMIIPYDVEKIQREAKWFSVDTIRAALVLFKKFGFIYEENDGTLVLSNHAELVGSETKWAEIKRNQRKAIDGQTQDNAGLITDNVHPEIRDKEIRDKDIRDKEIREEDIRDKEENKEESKVAARPAYDESFEKWWAVYPRKQDKALAYKQFNARLKDGWTFEELMTAAVRYAEECLKNHTEVKYIKQAKTFLSVNTPFVEYFGANDVVVDDSGGNPFDGI